MASKIWPNNGNKQMLHQDVVELFPEIPITTSGAVGTLTATKTLGIKACVQAAAAAAAAGGSLYVLSLNDKYVRTLSASVSTYGRVPAVSAVQMIADNPSGSVGVVVCASAAGADTVTIQVPGSAAVTYTAVAYNATPADNEWCVGNSTGADAESANNLAACIRNDADDSDQAGKGDTNGNGGSTTTPSTLTAWAVGSVCVVRCTVAGALIKSSNATRLRVVCDAVGTANVDKTMQPGLVLQTAVGITGTVPAAGDVLRLKLEMLNSQN